LLLSLKGSIEKGFISRYVLWEELEDSEEDERLPEERLASDIWTL
jgi:hypothetical protein